MFSCSYMKLVCYQNISHQEKKEVIIITCCESKRNKNNSNHLEKKTMK
jgi:hypothetical protein